MQAKGQHSLQQIFIWIWVLAMIANLFIFSISQWKGHPFKCEDQIDRTEFGNQVWNLLCSSIKK
jgi:hypothetical protein